MSAVNEDWNPDDGPPPSPEERDDARALDELLSRGAEANSVDSELSELARVALRVKATTRPVDELSAAAAKRALRAALDADRPVARVLRLRWGVAAAVAAAGILAVAVGLRAPERGAPSPSLSLELPPAFTEAVQPGAGAAPATRLFERRLQRYRESYLRRGAR